MFADGVMETSATLGVSDYVCGGAVYNGKTFASAFVNNAPVAFIAQTLGRSKYEIGYGVYLSASNTITRATILLSSSANAKINWQAGDNYVIASFASATMLGGFVYGNHFAARPWWIKFGQWIRSGFATNQSELNFFDGVVDIPYGIVDYNRHKLSSIFMPAGAMMAYAGASAPTGFLLCNGAALNRTDYPQLFTAIGTTYGAPSGTQFSLPDLRGRDIIGMDPNATGRMTNINAAVLGATGGNQNNTAVTNVSGSTAVSNTGADSARINNGNVGSGTSFNYHGDGGHTHALPAISVSASGTSGAFSVVQPGIVLNWIISTGI